MLIFTVLYKEDLIQLIAYFYTQMILIMLWISVSHVFFFF